MPELEERPINRPACELQELGPVGGDSASDRYGLASHSMACLPPEVLELFKSEPEVSPCDKGYQDAERLTGVNICQTSQQMDAARGLMGGGAGWAMATKLPRFLKLVKGSSNKVVERQAAAMAADGHAGVPTVGNALGNKVASAAPEAAESTLSRALPIEERLFMRIIDSKNPLILSGDVTAAVTKTLAGRIVHQQGPLYAVEYRAGQEIVRRGPNQKIIETIDVPKGETWLDIFHGTQHLKLRKVPIRHGEELARGSNVTVIQRMLEGEIEKLRRKGLLG